MLIELTEQQKKERATTMEIALLMLGSFGSLPFADINGGPGAINLVFAGSGLLPGNYHIVLFADVAGLFPEIDDNNNIGSFLITLVNPTSAPSIESNELIIGEQRRKVFIDRTPDIDFPTEFNDATIPIIPGLEIIEK